MLGLLAAAAALAPWLFPGTPFDQNLAAGLQAPSAAHWLGTDQLGRDLLTRLVYAGRTDLTIMVLAQVVPFCTGVFIGLVAGYFGGWLDTVINLITDAVIAFPFYLIVIIVAFASGTGQQGIYTTFALIGWVVYARVVRGLASTFRNQDWMLAAQTMGYSHARILFRHLLPNVLPQALVVLMTDMAVLLVAIVTLGYLGIGITPPTPDWGTMVADGRQFITSKWWLSALPGLAVVYTGIALSLVGDGLSDHFRRK
jgi:peptide/nickel transport system permease protein